MDKQFWEKVADRWNEEVVEPIKKETSKMIDCVVCKGKGYTEESVNDNYCKDCDGFGYHRAELDTKGFVNVYSVTRHYGGPEEGGWYYNWLTCIESFPCRFKNRHEIMEYMESEHAEKRYGNIYSVLGGEDVELRWEESPSESESKERPHYE
jgi:hypothetical protein